MITVTLGGNTWDEILQAAEAMCAGGEEEPSAPTVDGAPATTKKRRGRKTTVEVPGVGTVATTFPATEVRTPEKSDPTKAAENAAISQIAPATAPAAALTLGDVKKALQGYLTKFGLPKAAQLVQAKTGVPKLVDAPESTWPALVQAIDAEMKVAA